MDKFFDLQRIRVIFFVAVAVCVLAGIFFRLYNLVGSGFFFYDEGLYLGYDLLPLELVRMSPPHGLAQNWHAFLFYMKTVLGSGKSLWFLVMDSRVFFGGVHFWGYAKMSAAFFGIATLPLVYVFAKRFYRSKDVAFLAVAIMALLPSGVFYSRIGLQEALSTFLVLSGFYFYIFSSGLSRRTILAGIILAAAFFSNYRLLMLPLLVFTVEAWMGFVEKKGFDLRKFVWCCVSFFSCVVLIGSLLDSANMRVVFAWVFHQGQMAGGKFSWVNFLSYPYYLFRLETWLFAVLFFGNIYFIVQRRWNVLLPFVLVCVQMLIFSLPEEKGARYIAVVLPFAVMSVAFLIRELVGHADRRVRGGMLIAVCLLFVFMTIKSAQLAQAASAHQKAVGEILARDPDAKFFSSQELVDVLYMSHRKNVQAVPRDFETFVDLGQKGFRYLILDPQVYVSQTQGDKFTPQLRGYLSFIDAKVPPVMVLPHMNNAFLERFVFEHSENLPQSIRFLADPGVKRSSELRIYELSQVLPFMSHLAGQMGNGKKK